MGFLLSGFGMSDTKINVMPRSLRSKASLFAERDNAILFGSEIKALLAHPLVKAEINKEGLTELFGLGPMRTPGHAIFKDITELRAGHYLIATSEETRIEQYWKLKSQPHTDDVDTTITTIRTMLEDTVQRQLIADKPVVCMLSGD